jgi:HPt (histidine-containing phosphotransfer) domain-containing protein
MPSPPLVPDADTAMRCDPDDTVLIDGDHLDRMTLGDCTLKREALELFVRQSAELMRQLSETPGNVATTAHKLKGSALGIGAFPAAERAQRLETAAGDRRSSAEALRELERTISVTVAAIEGLLRQA